MKDDIEEFLTKPKRENDIYVVVDGEPNPIPRSEKIDVTITTKRDLDLADLYIPYYALHAHQYNKDVGELFESTVPKRTSFEKWQSRNLIAFIYSNDNTTRYKGSADRSLFYQLLVKHLGSRVHNLGGKQCRTIKNLVTDNHEIHDGNYGKNDNVFSNYKFVVAFENDQIRGYVSEKMLNPLLGGAIPVYLGAQDVDEHINPACFTNVAEIR